MRGSSGLLEAIKRLADAAEKDAGFVRGPLPRDYVPCRWCGGGSELSGDPGCAACFNARQQRRKDLDEEYRQQFPDGPKPIMTARLDRPEEVEALKRVAGREAIEKAFGPDGGGINEVLENASREMKARESR